MYSDEYENEAAYVPPQKMEIINFSDLMDERIERIDWIVEGLLKPGLSVLAGAPKVGKSWMVLQMCLAVARGEPFWGMDTRQGSVLYISLEDSKLRLQERILRVCEEPAEKLDFTVKCPGLGMELASEIADYTIHHRDACLVVIDTFQKIREQAGQMSYAGDYADVSYIKEIADQLHICILLVHHTRKMGDSDYVNEISGTNGIAGSADTLMILKKEKRSDNFALLSCTGRDIEDREIKLCLDRETCIWDKVNDTYQAKKKVVPPQMLRLIVLAGKLGYFEGSNTEFCERFNEFSGENFTPSRLKRMMNLYRFELEDAGVFFLSVKRNGSRRLGVYYKKREDSGQQSEEEAAMWDEPQADAYDPESDDMPPTPGDEDAPPLRSREEEEALSAYRSYKY